MLRCISTVHKCIKFFNNILTYVCLTVCWNLQKQSFLCEKAWGMVDLCHNDKPKRIFAQRLKDSSSTEKWNILSNCFTYHSQMIVLCPQGDTAFLKQFGWQLLSAYLRWQRECSHTARAVLLPVFNSAGWLQWTKWAECGLIQSDHLLMHMKCNLEKIDIANLWINHRRHSIEL